MPRDMGIKMMRVVEGQIAGKGSDLHAGGDFVINGSVNENKGVASFVQTFESGKLVYYRGTINETQTEIVGG